MRILYLGLAVKKKEDYCKLLAMGLLLFVIIHCSVISGNDQNTCKLKVSIHLLTCVKLPWTTINC